MQAGQHDDLAKYLLMVRKKVKDPKVGDSDSACTCLATPGVWCPWLLRPLHLEVFLLAAHPT